MKKRLVKYFIPLILAFCIISRLPQLFSPNLFLDGDECIEGLMAKHFSEGKEFPLFFYGQSYGFSFIEVFCISIFYKLIGISDIAIKISILLLWSLGIIFFYKTLKTIDEEKNSWTTLLITLVFIFSPSWAIWSMKARGGYITAFFLTPVVTYMLFNKKWINNLWVYISIGFLLACIYQSQPLWLIGLFPILAYQLLQNKNISAAISLLSGTLIAMSIFYFIKLDISHFWSPQVFDFSAWEMKHIYLIPEQIYQSFTGIYEHQVVLEPNIITQITAWAFTICVLTTPVILIINIIKKKSSVLNLISFASILCTVAYITFTDGSNPRYLLPLTGFVLFWFYLFINTTEKKTIINSILIALIISGAISMYDFKNYSFENKKELKTLIAEIENRNIGHAYCDGGLLQWEVMFYSKEKIISRFKTNIDRYPDYIKQVDTAFNNNEKTALVGYFDTNDTITTQGFVTPEKKFYFIENPDKELLIQRGFNLEPAL